MVKIGCCGFPVEKERYFKHFSVVEIQQTFYQLPEKETVLKWRRQAPADFEFTLKVWQLITHSPSSPTYKRSKIKLKDEKKYGFFKPTEEVYLAWDETEKIVEILKAKIVVFQCPASFRPERENINNLKRFFKKIKRKDYIFVWEPRGEWDKDLIKGLCEELDLIHCVDPFKDSPALGRIRYFRLHGQKGYNYRYSDEEIKSLKKMINPKIDTYVMFNNVYMFEDALRFKSLF
ncbi:MAG: DUF72 domain-containing protein [Candidatus Omnitrophica bacterium]|nr:DUF72 domain-containing protein [Candidatus Omnitrophota bacterium]